MRTRREFLEIAGLAGVGALAASAVAKKAPTPSPSSRPMVKPQALKEGDTVGLVAPSSYIFDTWRIEDAVARLDSAFGLKSKLGRSVKARYGYMAGTEAQRLEDLHAMFWDPSVES